MQDNSLKLFLHPLLQSGEIFGIAFTPFGSANKLWIRLASQMIEIRQLSETIVFLVLVGISLSSRNDVESHGQSTFQQNYFRIESFQREETNHRSDFDGNVDWSLR
jgi:hypothetical protein